MLSRDILHPQRAGGGGPLEGGADERGRLPLPERALQRDEGHDGTGEPRRAAGEDSRMQGDAGKVPEGRDHTLPPAAPVRVGIRTRVRGRRRRRRRGRDDAQGALARDVPDARRAAQPAGGVAVLPADSHVPPRAIAFARDGRDGEAHLSNGVERDALRQDRQAQGRCEVHEEAVRGGGAERLGVGHQDIVGACGGDNLPNSQGEHGAEPLNG
mmetsp:Transcript_25721/g.54707  ORF Transcript_25721/g.54707 Transcript_25721/m.54707 type:complete len:213 (+) Transcript_25721:878-1516(+)